MNVLIVEDEITAVRHLKRLLLECDSTISVLSCLDSVSETVQWMKTNPSADLIFMDIQLSDGLSFEIFNHINITTPIIFCTAYDEYAVKAFRVNSIDYLLKPLDRQALDTSLKKFHSLQNQWLEKSNDLNRLLHDIAKERSQINRRILVNVGRKYTSLPHENIACAYTRAKIVTLVTLQGTRYSIDFALDHLEKLLGNTDFFRVNRQTLISIYAIDSFEHKDGRLSVYLKVPPKDGILVSRDKSTPFKNWMGGHTRQDSVF